MNLLKGMIHVSPEVFDFFHKNSCTYWHVNGQVGLTPPAEMQGQLGQEVKILLQRALEQQLWDLGPMSFINYKERAGAMSPKAACRSFPDSIFYQIQGLG